MTAAEAYQRPPPRVPSPPPPSLAAASSRAPGTKNCLTRNYIKQFRSPYHSWYQQLPVPAKRDMVVNHVTATACMHACMSACEHARPGLQLPLFITPPSTASPKAALRARHLSAAGLHPRPMAARPRSGCRCRQTECVGGGTPARGVGLRPVLQVQAPRHSIAAGLARLAEGMRSRHPVKNPSRRRKNMGMPGRV